jgi:nucleotide-binding universal stress UspA family protein
MAWKNILVHIKAYHDWSESIDLAIRLAKRNDARLTGLYTIRELAMLKLIFGAYHPAVQEAEARDAPLTAAMQARFRQACETAGITATWEVGEGNAQELLSLAGRCQDLVIVEQSPAGLDGVGKDVVEEVAISCGTPTLIVPRAGRFETIGKHVVVAWNHSRQSATAMHGALPLISAADHVTVLLGKERDLMPSIAKRPSHDVAGYLRTHAKDVSVVPFDASESEAGGSLLAAARQAGGDVLVMGAYGRSTWREFLLGGATRSVISRMDLPVLMAH